MITYIATFFTHFDAISFAKALHKNGLDAKPMPVPRRLSSSCGTCVKFTSDASPLNYKHEGIEQIVSVSEDHYQLVWDNR